MDDNSSSLSPLSSQDSTTPALPAATGQVRISSQTFDMVVTMNQTDPTTLPQPPQEATQTTLPLSVKRYLRRHSELREDSARIAELVENYNQTARYLSLLDPDAKRFLFFTVLEDKQFEGDRPNSTLWRTLDDAWPSLMDLNDDGYGIFVCINETNGGYRKLADITGVRAVWIDHDQPDQPEVPTRLPPQIRVMTSPGKSQRLFLTQTKDFAAFTAVQDHLVCDYGSDPGAADLSRCLRLPGFRHMKDPTTPHLVTAEFSPTAERYPWAEITAAFPALPPAAKPAPAPARQAGGRGMALRPVSLQLGRVASALNKIPPDCPYDEWLRIGMALHATEEPEAFDLWDAWSAQGDTYRRGETKAKWETFSIDPDGVTLGTLFHLAKGYGWTEEDGIKDAQAQLLNLLVYAAELDAFYNLATGAYYTQPALNRLYAHLPWGESKSAGKWFTSHYAAKKCDNLTYLPGKASGLVRFKGKPCFNLWRPTDATYIPGVTADDIAPYLELAAYLIPDERVLGHILDTFAFVIQHQDIKVNHCILVSGAHGIGKDTLFQPLIHGLGVHNVAQPSASEMHEKFTDALLSAKCLVYQEVQNFDKTEIENKLKPIIAAPPEELRLRLFGKGYALVPNRVFVIMMSNHRNALKISPGDRRYLAYWSPAEPRPQTFYRKFYDWLNAGGNDQIYSWLKDRDVSAYDPKAPAPLTEYKQEVIGMGLSDAEARIAEFKLVMADEPDRHLYTLEEVIKGMGYDEFHKNEPGRPTEQRLRTLLLEAGFQSKSVRFLKDGKRERKSLWFAVDHERYQSMTEAQLVKAYDGQRAAPVTKLIEAAKPSVKQSLTRTRGRRRT